MCTGPVGGSPCSSPGPGPGPALQKHSWTALLEKRPRSPPPLALGNVTVSALWPRPLPAHLQTRKSPETRCIWQWPFSLAACENIMQTLEGRRVGACRQLRSVNDSTWGRAAPTPSLPPSQAPPPQPCRPGHPTLSHIYPSCSPLPSTWEICPLFLPPPHRLLARPWPYPAPRSPQFYFSPYNLTSTQQPDDPLQSEQINRITPRRKSTCPSGLQVLSDTGPAFQSSASTSHWFFLPFLKQAMLVPPSLTSCLECVSSRG